MGAWGREGGVLCFRTTLPSLAYARGSCTPLRCTAIPVESQQTLRSTTAWLPERGGSAGFWCPSHWGGVGARSKCVRFATVLRWGSLQLIWKCSFLRMRRCTSHVCSKRYELLQPVKVTAMWVWCAWSSSGSRRSRKWCPGRGGGYREAWKVVHYRVSFSCFGVSSTCVSWACFA